MVTTAAMGRRGRPLTLERYHRFFLDPWGTRITHPLHAWFHQDPPWQKGNLAASRTNQLSGP
uniref:Uncharacterized protein n=1 Tax=Arundo donax TaxID=35708 RepID=A0A0A8ZRZ2_ARUDO